MQVSTCAVLLLYCSSVFANDQADVGNRSGNTAQNLHADHSHQSLVEWEKGIQFEKEFWDSWMAKKGIHWPEDFQNRIRKVRPLQTKLVEAIPFEKDRKSVLILDCGAGPLSIIGNTHPDFEIELIAVDPLSKIYDELLAKHKIQPYPRTQYSMVERVNHRFPASFFDIVHIANALDHSNSPIAGILAMLEVVKVGGKVILFHGRNEAINEGWAGFHQWDFDLNNVSEFTIRKKNEPATNVNMLLEGKAKVQSNWATAKNDQIETTILKLV